MKNSKTKNAIKVLVGSKKIILSRLRQVVKNDKDYILAPNKNYFPDFQLKTSPILAIEYKSGNEIKLEKGKWASCKNSNNDMGTLNTWLSKIKKFGNENIYYVFVIYKFNNATKEITDIQ